MKNMQETLPSRWPHRIAMLLTAIVFPLIWLGGLVTTYDAGMAVPDWPNTYNYNMFAYPVRDWFFGPWDLFVEHGHRLLATLAGLVAIVLVVVTSRSEPRKWVRWMAIGGLALVIFQGLLGGARVLLDARLIAKIHGCVGPLFFAYSVALCVVMSRWWASRATENRSHSTSGVSGVGMVAIVLLTLSFAQLVLGAFLRHVDVMAPAGQYMLLIVAHVVVALLLLGGTFVQWGLTRKEHFRGRGVRMSINVLVALVFVQVGLGFGTWVVKYGWPIWFEQFAFAAQFVVSEKSFLQMNLITAHVAVGSLILGFWVVHSLRLVRDVRHQKFALESGLEGALDEGGDEAPRGPRDVLDDAASPELEQQFA